MGYALAEAAAARGARVILVSGPVSMPAPPAASKSSSSGRQRRCATASSNIWSRPPSWSKPPPWPISASTNPPESEDQEDRRPRLARTRPHARYPRRIRPQEGRPPADRFRRRNPESRAGSPPQAGIEGLRHDRGEPGRRRASPVRERAERSNPACSRMAKMISTAARQQARSRRPHLRQVLKLRLVLHAPMNADPETSRQKLEYLPRSGR